MILLLYSYMPQESSETAILWLMHQYSAVKWLYLKTAPLAITLRTTAYTIFSNTMVKMKTSNKKMITENFACPCCGYKTFTEEPKGQYDICEVCYWMDDAMQSANPDYEGGGNKFSLKQAQKNFIEFGACEKGMIKNVRQPNKEEQRDANWKLFQ